MAENFFDGQFYKRRITFNYFDTDVDRKVFIHRLLGESSELGVDESEQFGENHQFFVDHGVVFMLTRMSLRFHRAPVHGEAVVFTTWFRGTEGRIFLRNCEASGEDGELLVSMAETCALIDLLTHTTLPPERNPGTGSQPFPNKVANAPECKKILALPGMQKLGERVIRYTDLDCNNHANNTTYNRIAVDFLPLEYQSRDIADYVVNFNRETKLGETLEIRGGAAEQSYVIQGYVGETLHFGSEFTFRD